MSTQTIRSPGNPDLGEVTSAISRAITAIASGARASSDWRRLNALTEAELARRGLTREGIARAVLERNFA